jgi:hypothetical protein
MYVDVDAIAAGLAGAASVHIRDGLNLIGRSAKWENPQSKPPS